MTHDSLSVQPAAPGSRRAAKFTLERIQQIRNLVERGKSREEIAELVGVTVGTLQVACSNLGISLRRPFFNTGTGLLQPRRPHFKNGTAHNSSPNGSASLQLITKQPPQDSRSGLVEDAKAAKPLQGRTGTHDAASPTFSIRIRYKGVERTTEVPLTHDMILQLAFEAESRHMKFSELIGELIAATVKRELCQLVLGQLRPSARADAGATESLAKLSA